jgi:hypothetical protein
MQSAPALLASRFEARQSRQDHRIAKDATIQYSSAGIPTRQYKLWGQRAGYHSKKALHFRYKERIYDHSLTPLSTLETVHKARQNSSPQMHT